MRQSIESLQHAWFESVNHFARITPALHTPMRAYAAYGVVLFAALLALAWWRARHAPDPRTMAAALWAPVGVLVALALNQPLGNFVGETRPYTVFPHALMLVAHSQDFSFPSDHAVMAGAVAAGVSLSNRRLGVLTAVAAVVLGFARVYVGAHFPLDVIAGLFFGAGVVALGYLVARRPLVVGIRQLARTPAGPLVQARGEVWTR
ncbi:MAG: phosphatase PAP2 family protein [Marmoricola sp.]